MINLHLLSFNTYKCFYKNDLFSLCILSRGYKPHWFKDKEGREKADVS